MRDRAHNQHALVLDLFHPSYLQTKGLDRMLSRVFVAQPEPFWGLISAMVRPLKADRPGVSEETQRRFQAVILPHLDSAYNFARFLCRDPDAAGDIVQDAFLRAYRGFEGYHSGNARAWLFAIIRNCYRAWRNDQTHKARLEVAIGTDGDGSADDLSHQLVSDGDTPEAASIRHSESDHVRRVIAGMSEPMREVLMLREFEDFSYRQIAEVLEIPIGTVMSRLARARAEFEEMWRTQEAHKGRGR